MLGVVEFIYVLFITGKVIHFISSLMTLMLTLTSITTVFYPYTERNDTC